jgi:thymidylate synthase
MKKKPKGKKHLVSTWNPGDIPKMSLPPCHVLYQMTSNEEGELDMQLYQRSCDQFLGVPFNIASYAMLTQVIAQETGLIPRRFVHTFGDSHFYTGPGERSRWYRENFRGLKSKLSDASKKQDYLKVLDWINKKCPQDGISEKYDHITAILEQMSREPKKLPQLKVTNKSFDELTFEDFKIENYNSHPAINRKMSV